MTTTLTARIIATGSVDTRNYRYIAVNGPSHYYGYYGGRLAIMRLATTALGTTAAINGWELVKEF